MDLPLPNRSPVCSTDPEQQDNRKKHLRAFLPRSPEAPRLSLGLNRVFQREKRKLSDTWICQSKQESDTWVQRGHDRSFQPYSPMGWRVALRSGRVHKLCQRLRSSGSRYAQHRSHIRQLRRARTIRHGPGRASGRANWCGDGPGRPRPTRGRHTRRPGGRVVCTGIDNPGSNVFPASRPVWQWGGTRYNFYLALRLMRRRVVATPLFISRVAKGMCRSPDSCSTEALALSLSKSVRPTLATHKKSWTFCRRASHDVVPVESAKRRRIGKQ